MNEEELQSYVDAFPDEFRNGFGTHVNVAEALITPSTFAASVLSYLADKTGTNRFHVCDQFCNSLILTLSIGIDQPSDIEEL